MLCSRWQWDWVSALKWLLMLFSWTFFFTWLSIYHRMDQKEWMGVFTIPVWSIDSAVRSENRRRLAFSSMDYCTLKSITLMVVLCRHSALITNDLRPYKWRFFFPSNIILLRDTHIRRAPYSYRSLFILFSIWKKYHSTALHILDIDDSSFQDSILVGYFQIIGFDFVVIYYLIERFIFPLCALFWNK